MIRSKHFTIDELLPFSILDNLSPESAWRLVSPFTWSLDKLRDLYGGPISINGDGRKWCGFRPVVCPVGADKSRHKGYDGVQAFDLHASDMPLLVAIVRKHSKALGINRIEHPDKTPGWLHVEICQYPIATNLVEFNP